MPQGVLLVIVIIGVVVSVMREAQQGKGKAQKARRAAAGRVQAAPSPRVPAAPPAMTPGPQAFPAVSPEPVIQAVEPILAARPPLPHEESAPDEEGGEGKEGEGVHPCVEHEDSGAPHRAAPRITARALRQAVITREILDRPVSLRQRRYMK